MSRKCHNPPAAFLAVSADTSSTVSPSDQDPLSNPPSPDPLHFCTLPADNAGCHSHPVNNRQYAYRQNCLFPNN